ncbi:DUF3619 family protein [Sulfuriferula plumbiphila]|uniref:DUF3619 family protein n=1 Tax=Sulfuriferula plumbiphila TaxID=171865 RepID=UPI0011BE4638|nr:DUF3619 family protein [Sulfuriferula plumbiphila]
MNEEDFSRKVIRLVDADINNIRPEVAQRLRQVRELAVAHAQQRRAASFGLSGDALHRASWFSQHRLAGVGVLLVIALLAATGIWQISPKQQEDDVSQIDAALLTDDLPVHAYLDNSLVQWIKNPSGQ